MLKDRVATFLWRTEHGVLHKLQQRLKRFGEEKMREGMMVRAGRRGLQRKK